MLELCIAPASPEDAPALTALSFASKRVWGDPEAWFEIWRQELTVDRDYIRSNRVLTARIQGAIVGYVSLVSVPETFWAGKVRVSGGEWLEHLFVSPEHLRRGVGTALFAAAVENCRARGIERFRIFSDPHACGFYDRMGAVFLGDTPSSIEGRNVGLYEYRLYQID